MQAIRKAAKRLGKAGIVSIALSLVVVVGAVAAFAYLSASTIRLEMAPGVDMAITTPWTCSMNGGTPGTVVKCDAVGNGVDAEFADLDLTSQARVNVFIRNNNAEPVCMVASGFGPMVYWSMPAALPAQWDPGQTREIEIQWRTATAEPDAVYDLPSAVLTFTIGECP